MKTSRRFDARRPDGWRRDWRCDKEELILMHAVMDMGVGADPSSLRRFAPLFVEAVEKWREKAKNVCEGRDLPKEAPPTLPGGGKPGDQRYIKI